MIFIKKFSASRVKHDLEFNWIDKSYMIDIQRQYILTCNIYSSMVLRSPNKGMYMNSQCNAHNLMVIIYCLKIVSTCITYSHIGLNLVVVIDT